MPTVRPFRALRYDLSAAGAPVDLVSPPYDVITQDVQTRLAARSPYNAVHVDFPPPAPGDDADGRYGRAARAFAEWRTAGVLRKDPRLALYPYEQRYTVPGTGIERTQRGFFARLRLEPFAPGGGVRPHERTMSGPKEDRYRLLKATGVNTSAVVMLYDGTGRATGTTLAHAAAAEPVFEVVDDDGTCHRLWSLPWGEDGSSAAERLGEAASTGPVTIADGHHRYETALRYREERARTRACAVDPPYEFVFVLLLDLADNELTVLPTHRLLRDGPTGDDLVAALEPFGVVEPLQRSELALRFAPGREPAGTIGVASQDRAALLRVSDAGAAALLGDAAGTPLGSLEVARLGALLERVANVDASAAAAGRIGYTRDADEALRAVATGDATAAFLLPPVAPRAVAAVAAAGDVMPQKSTYFFPKPLTGPLFCPLEW